MCCVRNENNHIACEAVRLARIKAIKQLTDYTALKISRIKTKKFFLHMLVENHCSRHIFCRHLRSLLPVMPLGGLCSNLT